MSEGHLPFSRYSVLIIGLFFGGDILFWFFALMEGIAMGVATRILWYIHIELIIVIGGGLAVSFLGIPLSFPGNLFLTTLLICSFFFGFILAILNNGIF